MQHAAAVYHVAAVYHAAAVYHGDPQCSGQHRVDRHVDQHRVDHHDVDHRVVLPPHMRLNDGAAVFAMGANCTDTIHPRI